VQRSPQGIRERMMQEGKGREEDEGGSEKEKMEMWEELRAVKKELEKCAKRMEKMEREMEEWKRKEERIKEERDGLLEKVKVLEKKEIDREKEIIERGKKKGGIEGGESKEKLEGRVEQIERNLEWRDREERRRKNLVIKGVQKEKGDWRWGVEKIWKEIGVEVSCEEMRRLNIGKEERGDMVWIKLGKEEDKKLIWSKKKSLKGKKIWIDEDWTWKEREIRRKLGKKTRYFETLEIKRIEMKKILFSFLRNSCTKNFKKTRFSHVSGKQYNRKQ